ncbi:MAG: hypothetical protein AAFR69_11665, partial [Pseudomonadota bacterium]
DLTSHAFYFPCGAKATQARVNLLAFQLAFQLGLSKSPDHSSLNLLKRWRISLQLRQYLVDNTGYARLAAAKSRLHSQYKHAHPNPPK